MTHFVHKPISMTHPVTMARLYDFLCTVAPGTDDNMHRLNSALYYAGGAMSCYLRGQHEEAEMTYRKAVSYAKEVCRIKRWHENLCQPNTKNSAT